MNPWGSSGVGFDSSAFRQNKRMGWTCGFAKRVANPYPRVPGEWVRLPPLPPDMKTFKYETPNPDGSVETTVLTEDELIERYWDYWCEQMRKVGKEDLISRENCIEDFIVVHWAWRIE